MCPCASFWPMVWYIPINSETGCSLWAHVSVCAHVPPCGQCFDTYLNPLRLCELMCQFVPMCSYVANVLIHTYNFRDWFAVLSSYDWMCQCALLWQMVWWILWDWLYVINSCVSMCSCALMCSMILYIAINLGPQTLRVLGLKVEVSLQASSY